MTAFASVDDLALLTGRTFTAGQEEQVEALLEAASSHLRGIIGQDIFPGTTSTYTGYPSGGREDLPQWPIVSVDAVQRDDVDVDFTYRPGYIIVGSDEPVDITFTWGYPSAPAVLNNYACILAGQALTTVELGLGLSAGGLSSLALDDFKAAFADGGAETGMVLTPQAEKSIRKQFSQGDMTVVGTAS